MITPKLEQMIHEGIASSRTFVCGLSGNCVLDVPKDAYIVIHNICYHPFYDIQEGVNGNTDKDKIIRINKQVQFKSQQSDNHFIFRDSGLFVQNAIILDTYLVHFDSVAISFLVQPVISRYASGISPTTSVVQRAPTGYGGLTSLLAVNLEDATQQYQPANSENSGTVTTNDYRGEYKLDHTKKTIVIDPSMVPDGEILSRSLPLLNVQYVLINKAPTDKVQASS